MKCTTCSSDDSETLDDGTVVCSDCGTILYTPINRKTDSLTFGKKSRFEKEKRKVKFEF